jgi:NADH-quinone oxidoreductase subunit M
LWNMPIVTSIAALGVVIGAAYSLWLLKRLFYGPIKPEWLSLPDAKPSELWVLGTLALLTVVFGVYPGWVTQQYDQSVAALSQAYHARLNTPVTAPVALVTPSPVLLGANTTHAE